MNQMSHQKIDPYHPCPCGSGRKYKFCCREKEQSISNQRPLALIEQSVKYPVCQCVINRDWESCRLATVFVVRQLPNAKFIIGLYLVDLLCLGVKNTFFNANLHGADIQTMFAKAGMPLISIDYEDARSIVLGGIEYAQKIGIAPHQDWQNSKHIVESEKPFNNKYEHEYGRNGKPVYFAGQDDDSVRIISRLSS